MIETELDSGFGPTKVMTALSVLKVFGDSLNHKPADQKNENLIFVAEWGGMMKE